MRSKSQGIVRKLDDLHRLVIPQEYCKVLNWDGGTPVAITQKGDSLIVTRSVDSCAICGNTVHLKTRNNVSICQECIAALASDETKDSRRAKNTQ